MKLKEMSLFAAVCRTGSVTKGAESVNISQPAASTMLRELEEKLGVQLFTRHKRKLEVTSDGRLMLAHVTHALAAVDAVERTADSMGRGKSPRLTIGAVTSASSSIVPGAIALTKDIYPDLTVVIRAGTAAEIVEMAFQERIDIGVVIGAPIHEHVEFKKLVEASLECVMLGSHPLAEQTQLTIEQVAATQYISHSRHLPVGALTASALETRGFAFKPAIEVAQFSTACSVAKKVEGTIAILDSLTARYAESLGLTRRPISMQGELAFYLVWPRAKGMTSWAKCFTEGLYSTVAQM